MIHPKRTGSGDFSSADGGERMGVGRKRKFHRMAGAGRRHLEVASRPGGASAGRASGTLHAASEVTIWKLQLQLQLCFHENAWQTSL